MPSSTSISASAEEDGPLQSGWGGLAGSTVHPLALGNVARLAQLLRSRTDEERLKGIVLIGVGGAGDAEAVERFRRAGADAVVSLFFFFPSMSLFFRLLPSFRSSRLFYPMYTLPRFPTQRRRTALRSLTMAFLACLAKACATALGREGPAVFEKMARMPAKL